MSFWESNGAGVGRLSVRGQRLLELSRFSLSSEASSLEHRLDKVPEARYCRPNDRLQELIGMWKGFRPRPYGGIIRYASSPEALDNLSRNARSSQKAPAVPAFVKQYPARIPRFNKSQPSSSTPSSVPIVQQLPVPQEPLESPMEIELPSGGLDEAWDLAEQAEEEDAEVEVLFHSDAFLPTDEYAQPHAPASRSLYPDRFPWIVPPMVRFMASGGGGRNRPTRFVKGMMEDGNYAMFQAARQTPAQSSLFYDRDNRRSLVLPGYSAPLGVVDEDRYGLPAPELYYFELRHPTGWIAVRPSKWIYRSMDPDDNSWAGKKAPKPRPEQLPPLVSSTPPLSSQDKSKGKAKEPTQAPREPRFLSDLEPTSEPTVVIVLEDSFEGRTARQVWNSELVSDMRNENIRVSRVARTASDTYFQFPLESDSQEAYRCCEENILPSVAFRK
ncbi:hypothetical protein C8F01DRAFT_1096119 [Mycena amicta]|nr:hypothetical protein C8F01DRAFT_1096119 [Mycena amicta]